MTIMENTLNVAVVASFSDALNTSGMVTNNNTIIDFKAEAKYLLLMSAPQHETNYNAVEMILTTMLLEELLTMRLFIQAINMILVLQSSTQALIRS
jgi:hypothetical protein